MSLGTSIFCGHLPVGSRQTVDATFDFAGVAPALGADVFVADSYSNGVVTYTKDGDESVFEGDAGGLFEFGNVAVEVTKIFCEAEAGVNELKVVITDPDGLHPIIVQDWTVTGIATISFNPPVTILPNHLLKISSRSSLLAKTVTVITERAVKKA